MRILHVITQLDKVYGARRHVVESVRDHLKNGHQYTVVSGEIGIASAEIEVMGVHFLHLQTHKKSYNLFSDFKTASELKKNKNK